MSPKVRITVLNEVKRVLKNDGRILLIDFHPGPVRLIKGWILKSIITLSEIGAGKTHYNNYRNYMKNGGLLILIKECGLTIEHEKIVSGGNFAIYIVKYI